MASASSVPSPGEEWTSTDQPVPETISLPTKDDVSSENKGSDSSSSNVDPKQDVTVTNDDLMVVIADENDSDRALNERPEPLHGSTMTESDIPESYPRRSAEGSSLSPRRWSSTISINSIKTTSVVDPAPGLSRYALTCIVINYISSGFLLLPHAFAKAGTLLSTFVFACVALQAFMTSSFVLNACARAEALANSEILPSGGRVLQGVAGRRYSMAVRTRKYELTKLTHIFLGKWPTIFFTVALMGDLYTWLPPSVFGATFAGFLPFGSGDMDYKIYVLAFMAVTTPLTLVPILDQLFIQLIFLGARLLMVTLMLATVAVGYVSNVPQFGTQVGPVNDIPLADFGNLILVIQTAIFSTAFQFAVPTTASISQDKKIILPIFKVGGSFIFFSNLILALVLSIYFGRDNMQGSSNLNWEEYHSAEPNRPGWASCLRGYIVLFAAMDSLAVFPLIAISLSEIIIDFLYPENSLAIHLDWKKRSFFRLLASIPQVIGAMFMKELDILAIYGGIFTLISYTVCPSVLLIQSRRRMVQEDLPVWTHYTTIFSSDVWAWILIVAAAAVIVGIVVDQTIR